VCSLYGLSKAALCALTLVQAKMYPNLIVMSLTPGFIDTPMTKGFGAKLTPEQGCVSSLKCLFGHVTSGCYYGSDGLRSPLTVKRDPGTPEYQGEANPDPDKYQKKVLKHILVTGGNSGIGLALCKLLIKDHSCHVYLGSRDTEKGTAALKTIIEEAPDKVGQIEVVEIDVGNDASCNAAAELLRVKGVKLYALVNNAGTGLVKGGSEDIMMNTNYMGPKRVTEALVDLIDPAQGRIVNTSSGAASGWLKKQDASTKKLFTDPNLTFDELDESVKRHFPNAKYNANIYGLSKAALCALTLVQAKTYPNLTVTSLSPGFIDTPMTKGYGAKLTPEQGCISALKCLFGSVTSGHYYGSDGLRSPLTVSRDPGTSEYQGEADPDPAKYKK